MTQSLLKNSRSLVGGIIAFGMSVISMTANADTMYLSHGVKITDPVYPYTGFTVNEDIDDMYVAIRLTSEMLAPFSGSQITALHIGWAGGYQQWKPTATAFLRPDLNGENITTASVDLVGSWNVATFDEPYTINDGDELVMGYFVDMKKGVYGPCTITWGTFDEDTHFIANPNYTDEDGNMEWVDISAPGVMEMRCPIMLVAEVLVGGDEFHNRLLISKAVIPTIVPADIPVGGGMQVVNSGSNNVSSFTVKYSQEGYDSWSKTIDLSNPIAAGSSAIVSVPVYAKVTGESVITISEVNGSPNNESPEWKFNPIAVPEAVATNYERRPLMEYFASESAYQSAAYDEGIVSPAYDQFADRISRINWHSSDQFQLGLADDRDEALELMLEIAKNDSSLIYFPTVMVDRSINLGVDARYSLTAMPTPMIGILYSPFAENSYMYALSQPTFAGINVLSALDGDEVTLSVEGSIALDVLPADEQLMLNVVLVEDGVESDSQEYPGGDGGSSNPGHVTHNYLVRQRLTSIEGDPIEVDSNGKFSAVLTTELDYDNVPSNMRAVAFVTRPMSNGMWERSVINTAECDITTTALRGIAGDSHQLYPEVIGSSIIAPEGSSMTVYTTDGKSIPANNLSRGIYIVKITGADGALATYKITVR